MYAASFYHLDSFRQTYAQTIVHCRRKQPMAPLVELLPPQEVDELNFDGSSESEDSSSDNGILPPVVRRPPDRPSNARKETEKKNAQCKQVRQLELLSVARAETLGIRRGPARGLRIRLVLINYIHIFSSFFEVALV